ncbi:MAG: T9SS type A sorting domain-containing protein [Elusimicrobiales bacterium]|nr:T9SS type A sorting domain-containing protein [Elusimicrobiales bacterium]
MKKSAGITGVFFLTFIGFAGVSHSADKKTERLYELYNSTSTSADQKPRLKHFIERRESIGRFRRSGRLSANRFFPERTPTGTAGVPSAVPPAADTAFKLGEVYCYPNPARRTNPTFHMETGLADKVQLKIYDVSGDLVHETTLSGTPQQVDDGQGPQLAYEYLWDTKNAGSGVYIFSITSSQGDKNLKRTGRCAVIK